MGLGQFFGNVQQGFNQYNYLKEWYQWYGFLLSYVPMLFYITLGLIALHLFERHYLHAKIDVANRHIEKIMQETNDSKANNEKIQSDLQDIKKQLKSLKQPSRIKRPRVEKKDEQKVRAKSGYDKRDNDGYKQQQNSSDDIFMRNNRTKYD